MSDFVLDDIEQVAAEQPDTFFIPEEVERAAQGVGDLVRLHFALTGTDSQNMLPKAERMWVEVSRPLIDGTYEGILTNEPRYITTIKSGDSITFEPRHIARTYIKKSDPRWVSCSELQAMVSARVLESEAVIRFVYREDPDNKRDSGWRMFTGTESEEYNKNPENIRLPLVGYLLNRDPTLREIIESEPGAAFEKVPGSKTWEVVS